MSESAAKEAKVAAGAEFKLSEKVGAALSEGGAVTIVPPCEEASLAPSVNAEGRQGPPSFKVKVTVKKPGSVVFTVSSKGGATLYTETKAVDANGGEFAWDLKRPEGDKRTFVTLADSPVKLRFVADGGEPTVKDVPVKPWTTVIVTKPKPLVPLKPALGGKPGDKVTIVIAALGPAGGTDIEATLYQRLGKDAEEKLDPQPQELGGIKVPQGGGKTAPIEFAIPWHKRLYESPYYFVRVKVAGAVADTGLKESDLLKITPYPWSVLGNPEAGDPLLIVIATKAGNDLEHGKVADPVFAEKVIAFEPAPPSAKLIAPLGKPMALTPKTFCEILEGRYVHVQAAHGHAKCAAGLCSGYIDVTNEYLQRGNDFAWGTKSGLSQVGFQIKSQNAKQFGAAWFVEFRGQVYSTRSAPAEERAVIDLPDKVKDPAEVVLRDRDGDEKADAKGAREQRCQVMKNFSAACTKCKNKDEALFDGVLIISPKTLVEPDDVSANLKSAPAVLCLCSCLAGRSTHLTDRFGEKGMRFGFGFRVAIRQGDAKEFMSLFFANWSVTYGMRLDQVEAAWNDTKKKPQFLRMEPRFFKAPFGGASP